jgi:hypothetical protein
MSAADEYDRLCAELDYEGSDQIRRLLQNNPAAAEAFRRTMEAFQDEDNHHLSAWSRVIGQHSQEQK